MTGTIQQLTSQAQQLQHSQANLLTTAVSVVLTSTPTTVSTVQAQPQNVSIQPSVATAVMNNTSTIVTQSTSGQFAQALGTQTARPHLVTLTSPNLRPQRIMTQKLFLQRPNAQTVVALSGGVNPTHLKLSMDNNQQFSGVVSKNIPVAVGMAGKTQSRIQFYRQQPQVKVIATPSGDHTAGTSGTIIPSGATTLQMPQSGTGALIQNSVGQTMQVQTNQKFTLSAINPGSSVSGSQQQTTGTIVEGGGSQTVGTSSGNVTVQVSGTGQQTIRPQFKQVTTTPKTGITRQILDSDFQVILAKGSIIRKTHPQQLVTTPIQGQIFSTANVQMQQQGQNSQQQADQVTTLLNTSGASTASGSGVVATGTKAGTLGMTLSRVKKGQIGNPSDPRIVAFQQVALGQGKTAAGKMTQIAQIAGKEGKPLIVQNPKLIPTTTNVQHVLKPGQGHILLQKSRVLPAGMQPNSRFQVSHRFGSYF